MDVEFVFCASDQLPRFETSCTKGIWTLTSDVWYVPVYLSSWSEEAYRAVERGMVVLLACSPVTDELAQSEFEETPNRVPVSVVMLKRRSSFLSYPPEPMSIGVSIMITRLCAMRSREGVQEKLDVNSKVSERVGSMLDDKE